MTKTATNTPGINLGNERYNHFRRLRNTRKKWVVNTHNSASSIKKITLLEEIVALARILYEI